MNAPKIKALSWLVAAALTLGLSYYVYDFVTHLEERRAKAEPEVVRIPTKQPIA